MHEHEHKLAFGQRIQMINQAETTAARLGFEVCHMRNQELLTDKPIFFDAKAIIGCVGFLKLNNKCYISDHEQTLNLQSL
jgi:hypothetical protein